MRHMTSDEFQRSIIAQDDDEDYSESGWVAGVLDGVAFLANYSHCSCYGTFEALCGGGVSDSFSDGDITVNWEGTVADLVAMAERKADPAMPERTITAEDYDGDHLLAVYAEVLEWWAKKQ